MSKFGLWLRRTFCSLRGHESKEWVAFKEPKTVEGRTTVFFGDQVTWYCVVCGPVKQEWRA